MSPGEAGTERTPGSAPGGNTTPGQTVGPFFGFGLPYPGGPELVPASHPNALRVHGVVLDGAGDPVPDALLELWQPDPNGRIPREPGSLHRDGYTFTGWGRAGTDNAGRYSFTTLPPAASPSGARLGARPLPASPEPEPARAPFFALAVFARGLLDRLFTRIYLPDDEVALAADPLLGGLPEERRRTLVAVRDPHGLRFDVVLQGEGETVFLAHRHG